MGQAFSPGIRYMLLSAFFFSLLNVLVKIVGQTIPSSEIVFARSLFSAALTYGMLRYRHIPPWGNEKKWLWLRGAVGFVGLYCFFYAIPRMPLADVSVILYTNPIFVALFAGLFLKERFGWVVALSTALSIVGVLAIAKPSFLFPDTLPSPFSDPIAPFVAFAGAIVAGAAYTLVRKLRTTEHPLVVVFYFPLVSTPAVLSLMWPEFVWPNATEGLLLLGIGVLTQLAQVTMTKGIHLEAAGKATAVGYVQIVFALFWGLTLFGEWPDTWSLLGSVLVFIGAVLLVRSK